MTTTLMVPLAGSAMEQAAAYNRLSWWQRKQLHRLYPELAAALVRTHADVASLQRGRRWDGRASTLFRLLNA